jgi:hypothetical protein
VVVRTGLGWPPPIPAGRCRSGSSPLSAGPGRHTNLGQHNRPCSHFPPAAVAGPKNSQPHRATGVNRQPDRWLEDHDCTPQAPTGIQQLVRTLIGRASGCTGVSRRAVDLRLRSSENRTRRQPHHARVATTARMPSIPIRPDQTRPVSACAPYVRVPHIRMAFQGETLTWDRREMT